MASQRPNYCPKCGYEYESWVEICPDCGILVEPVPDKRGHGGEHMDDGDPHWTVVTNVPNAMIGNVIKSQLEDAGIPVLMMRSKSADIGMFSHNDFVPYDLRVPRHLLTEARTLIDSAPGDSYGPQHWPVPGPDQPPGGWSGLPTEADMRARQQINRAPGEPPGGDPPGGWHWSDEAEPQPDTYSQAGTEEYDPRHDQYDYEYESPELVRERVANPYAPRGSETHNRTGPNKWVKIGYGIMLLAISLPFILQVLQQIWSVFSGHK